MYDIRVESKPLYHHQFHHDHIYSLSYNPIVENVIASGMTFSIWMDWLHQVVDKDMYIFTNGMGVLLNPFMMSNPVLRLRFILLFQVCSEYSFCMQQRKTSLSIWVLLCINWIGISIILVFHFCWFLIVDNLAICTHIPVNSIDFFDIRRRYMLS